MAKPTLYTSHFYLTGLNRKMFEPFTDIDSDYDASSDSPMANLMYERLAGKVLENLENPDWSGKQQVAYLKSLLHEFAMYCDEGVERFILHNSQYCIGFKIDIICTDYTDVWNNTLVYISFMKPD